MAGSRETFTFTFIHGRLRSKCLSMSEQLAYSTYCVLCPDNVLVKYLKIKYLKLDVNARIKSVRNRLHWGLWKNRNWEEK
jgi:hypothetical protein